MLEVPAPRPVTRALLALVACALTVLSVPEAMGGTDSTNPKAAKPSSFAPHPTAKRAFGTPVSKPILHKRKKRAPPAAPAPAEPIK
jgi:hypothetical protein